MHTIPAGYLIVNDVIYIAVVSYIFFKLTPSRKKIFRICYLPLTIIALIIDILACNLNDIVLITGTVLLSLLLDRGIHQKTLQICCFPLLWDPSHL